MGGIQRLQRTQRAAYRDVMERLQILIAKRKEIPDRTRFVAEATRVIMLAGLTDEEALVRLRELYLSMTKKATAHSSGAAETKTGEADTGRSASRVRDIQVVLDGVQEAQRPISYLDIGCSEGHITAAVADYLGIGASKAFGVDVVPQKAEPAFTFRQIDGNTLDFPDATFDLLTMFVSLHHFQNAAKMLSESHRVAKKGGMLIVREHDVHSPYLALWLDLLHAFYAVIFNAEETPAEFAKKYATGTYAYYHSRDDWTQLLSRAGWQIVRYIQPKLPGQKQMDFVNSYYGVYAAI